jgi:adenylate cyclase
MAILLDVANSVGETLDLPALIRKIVDKTSDVLHCDRSSFFVWTATPPSCGRWRPTARPEEIRFPVTGRLGRALRRARRRSSTSATPTTTRASTPPSTRRPATAPAAVLCVPVIGRDGNVTGVTQAINKVGGGAFEAGDVELLKAISAQIAVAVENAQLYARTVNMKNYLESVRESISNGILTLDNDYRVVTANAAALKALDRPLDAVVGSDLRAVLGPGNDKLVKMIDEAYATHGLVDEDDVELVLAPGPDGAPKTCTVNARTVPLTDPDGREQGQVLVIDDVTRERRMKSTLTRFMSRDIAEKAPQGRQAHARRRVEQGHRPVQRHPRVHDDLRGPARRAGHGLPQPVLHADGRRGLPAQGRARQVHGRRPDGRLRRALHGRG